MKETVKRIFATNGYINAFLYRTLSAASLKEMRSVCEEAAGNDSIQDITWLKQFQKDTAAGRRRFYTTDCNFSNAHIYGIWDGLFGDQGVDPIYTPSVEHGLILHDQIFNDIEDTARAACATFGPFRKQIIRKYTDLPVFCVGPYIHYASSYYDEERIRKEKEKNGRTLLVFPVHSTNNSELSVDISNCLNYLHSKEKEFDTILINTFWWNLNDPLTEALAAEGYRIVSAGFRDDVMFMRRLKTIIQMSDCVAGDSIGTHVGYCVHCGIPFMYEPLGSKTILKTEKENRDLEFQASHMERIQKAFYQQDAITEEQRELCRYYWGGDQIRTREELREITAFTQETMKRARGMHARYARAAHAVARDWGSACSEVIREALK